MNEHQRKVAEIIERKSDRAFGKTIKKAIARELADLYEEEDKDSKKCKKITSYPQTKEPFNPKLFLKTAVVEE